jgi:uncharacterized membrane protein YphA (DoxX/SURF4 family)
MSGYNHFAHLKNNAGYAESKGVPMPREAVMLTGLMMVLGGLGILLGVYIGLSVLLLSVFLIVTTLKMHQYWKVTDPMMRMGEQINFTKNFALLGAILMLLSIASWAPSLF